MRSDFNNIKRPLTGIFKETSCTIAARAHALLCIALPASHARIRTKFKFGIRTDLNLGTRRGAGRPEAEGAAG